MKTLTSTAVLALSLTLASTAFGQEATARQKTSLTMDVEVDPIAYVLNGHSLHAGLGSGRYRVDLGAFGLEMPEFLHGNEGFTSSFAGFGSKFDVYLRKDQWGLFVGVDGSLMKSTVALDGTELAKTSTTGQVGGRVGYRIKLPAGFYISPWIGVGSTIGAGDVELDGQVYEHNPLVIFPTIHLGYRAL